MLQFDMANANTLNTRALIKRTIKLSFAYCRFIFFSY